MVHGVGSLSDLLLCIEDPVAKLFKLGKSRDDDDRDFKAYLPDLRLLPEKKPKKHKNEPANDHTKRLPYDHIGAVILPCILMHIDVSSLFNSSGF